MGRHLILSLTVFALLALSDAADLTRQPNTYGPSVVEAVVNLIRETCLFADDRRFLRRLAYVESQDGTSPRTYRAGYDGGIWQVDQSAFLATKNNSTLNAEYNIIRNRLGIDWSYVSWHDLRKPLYSGIAAALYTKLELGTSGLSWKAEEQGNFWGLHFHGGSPATNFTQLAQILDLGCRTNQQVDLVFVMDTSSSLSQDDFVRSTNFINQVIDGFMISPAQTRVGVVTYSSSVKVDFYLNTYSSKSSVQNAVNNIHRVTGGTNTNLGIDKAVDEVFSPTHGARSGVVKVMIVITDGNSDDDINTKHAADKAHAHGIVTFSVGVGSAIGSTELHTIATEPDCTHAYKVLSYEDLKFLTEEIQKATCIAPLFITTTYSCEVSTCPPLAVHSGGNGTTIETNITCGGVNIYSSVSNPYPTSAQYEYIQILLANQPTEKYFNLKDTNLYINFQDNQGNYPFLNGSTGCIVTITPYKGDHTSQNITVRCFLGDREIHCNDSFFNCTEKWNFPDPCTHDNILAGKLRFPHPYQSNKFLMCDLSGKLYIVICPQGELFYADCSQCIGANSTVISDCVSGYKGSNPCTRENILKGNLYFAYPGDHTKYIHCDVWGHPWERNCQAGMEWDQGLLTCITPSAYNPCRYHQVGQPYLYPHNCDPHLFIHCDTNHQSFEQSCQLDFVFYTTAQVCVPPGSYPGTANLINTCNGYTTLHPPATIDYTRYYGVTSDPTQVFGFNNQPYAEPCTLANIQANNLYFPYKYNNHNYIQCDLYGHAYLRDCNQDYYDPYSHTCVDGPVFVDNQLPG